MRRPTISISKQPQSSEMKSKRSKKPPQNSMEIQENIPLASRTTFGIGGNARYFLDVKTESEIREAISWAHEKSIPFVVLSGGSNVLVPDAGLDALVIH